ncbi:autophagy protein 5 [Cryptotrichosporon argae]
MASSSSIHSSAALFRRLTWNATVPLEVRLADDTPGAGSAGRYYIQAPRYTYLPLLIPEIRENLVELYLDDASLDAIDESQWWFEEEAEEGEGRLASQGPCKWHWPIDLLDMHAALARPGPTPPSPRPLRLVLRLSNPPTDKLMVPPGAEACKTHFINQVKEADFVRWGNTKRVTAMRRADLDAGWDGLVQDDFDLHTRMASRVLPLPLPQNPPPAPSPNLPPRPASTEPLSSAKPDSVYSVRGLPIKLYLPDNAPVIQEATPPLAPDGKPTTLLAYLSAHLPLLFPAATYTLAEPVANGVVLPPDAELAWLASCVCGADGWLRIGIQLRE